MKKYFRYIVPVLMIIVQGSAQNQVTLSGTIINQADFPVKNMVVVLASQGFSDTSNADGEFEVTGEATSASYNMKKQKPALKFRGNNFLLSVPDGNNPVSMKVFNAKGVQVAAVMQNRVLSKGVHTLPVINNPSAISSSVLIAVIKHGADVYRFRIVKAGQNRFMIQETGAFNSNNAHHDQVAGIPSDLDTLQFIRNDSVEFVIPVTKWVDEFEVTLDLIPFEAVQFGVDEFNANRIYPDEVGTTLTEYPFAIKEYLRYEGPGPHDYEWWCSEYYSWVLRLAGCPITGTSFDPDWMIPGNTQIRDWFKSNSEFIYKNDIGDFKPLPGDFCHIEGHSAMVWYIDEDDSLYTVEANGDLDGDGTFDNMLALVNRGPYKNFKDLLGYGRRSGVVVSSYKSISTEW